jgi:hypothetical protein
LRRPQQNSAENRNEISTLDPELGLRDVPGKLVQWRTDLQRFRLSIALLTILYPARIKVVGMIRPPDLLLLPSPGVLTIGVSASTLTSPDSGIRTEPTAANRTRSLSGLGHGDSSSTTPSIEGGIQFSLPAGGHSR